MLYLLKPSIELVQRMLQGVESRHVVLQLTHASREIWNTRGLRGEEEPAHGADGDERSERDRAHAKEPHLALRQDERAIRESALALYVDDHRAGVRRVDVPVASLSGSVLTLSHRPRSSNLRDGNVQMRFQMSFGCVFGSASNALA